jgi:hypothetical protein
MSVIQEGNADLNEYAHHLSPTEYSVSRIGDRYYSMYPIGTPLLAAPVIWLVDRVLDTFTDESLASRMLRKHPVDRVEVFVASAFVAATAWLLHALATRRTDTYSALLVVGAFAFGSPAWSTASRALWQHGPSMLMLALALTILDRARDDSSALKWAGIPLAAAYVVRPTNIIPLVVFAFLVLGQGLKPFMAFALSALAILLPFLAYNLSTYGSLVPYYAVSDFRAVSFAEGLAGTLVSPARGLIVFCPIVLLCMVGMAVRRRRGEWRPLDTAIAVVVLLHWMVISGNKSWWGGHSYGPRLFVDMLPLLFYMLMPAVHDLVKGPNLKRAPYVITVALLVAIGVAVNYTGANRIQAWYWNVRPVNVDTEPGRLWDWRDPPFMRWSASN